MACNPYANTGLRENVGGSNHEHCGTRCVISTPFYTKQEEGRNGVKKGITQNPKMCSVQNWNSKANERGRQTFKKLTLQRGQRGRVRKGEGRDRDEMVSDKIGSHCTTFTYNLEIQSILQIDDFFYITSIL